MNQRTRHEERVAITGLGMICGLGSGTEAVWKASRDGAGAIEPTRRLDVSTLSCRYSSEIAALAPLGARRPRGRLDRACRLALAAADEALGSADIALSGLDPYRAGVALGTSVGGLDEGERFHWALLGGEPEKAGRHHLFVYPLYTSADAVSTAYGLKGPKVVISNACAAGANAIGYASDAIADGRADVMLAGGVDVLDILSLAGFDSLEALDPEPCAPYSRSSGLSLGEGVAMFVLEAESVALARGADILGYVLGHALTSDAHHATAPDPAGSGARRAMRRALERAALRPAEVDYVNGHGTGTPANDSAEIKAFDSLFEGIEPPPVSSTKSQIGHTLGAAGAVEAAICTLALRDQVLPPTVNVADPGSITRDIVPNESRPRPLDVVVSNSFAFGGNNCSIVLGRAAGEARERAGRRVVITGAGVVSPLGIGRTPFLEAITSGAVAIGAARTIDTAACASGLAAEVEGRSLRRYVDPAYVRRLDQLGLLVLAASRIGLQDASYKITKDHSERVGMIFGTYTGPLETVGRLSETIGTQGPHRVNPRLFPNSVMNAAAGHACLSLQIKGPLSTLATGCASGLTGLGYAADQIRRGEAEVMLAVSADELTSLLHLGYDRLGILSPSALRPYDRNRDGTVLGAGAVTVVLESLDHALERGATILGEVTGHAVTADAYRIAGNDPSGAAWAESFRRAIADADLVPGDIGAVYGDGRGTTAVDQAEARAVADVWRPGSIALANISGQAGHLHSTTPLLSLVCGLHSMSTGQVPRIQGLRDPLPEIEGHLGAPGEAAGRPFMVTSANWGGTYVSAVVRPFPAG